MMKILKFHCIHNLLHQQPNGRAIPIYHCTQNFPTELRRRRLRISTRLRARSSLGGRTSLFSSTFLVWAGPNPCHLVKNSIFNVDGWLNNWGKSLSAIVLS